MIKLQRSKRHDGQTEIIVSGFSVASDVNKAKRYGTNQCYSFHLHTRAGKNYACIVGGGKPKVRSLDERSGVMTLQVFMKIR
jgi:hypothetical protein